MPISSELMTSGFSAGQAQGVNGQFASTFSCAGTSQSDATAIVASNTTITTCADGAGAVLPSLPIGDSVLIYNSVTANPAIIYPPTSGTINQLAANAGMRLSPYTAVRLQKVTSTAWVGFLSA